MIDINTMTLEQKILQTKVALMEKGKKLTDKPGAVFFFGQIITEADDTGFDELRGYVNEIYEEADVPPLITSDFENGCGSMIKGMTELPYLMSLGATNDETLAYDYGRATALEARSIGANWSFSPVSDLNLNKRNPLVNVRSISDDAHLAKKMLKQVVKGMQEYGLAACAKHFPGDGVDYRDQHIVTTSNTLTFEEWGRSSGLVFKELIESGVDTIMAGHIALPSYQTECDEFGMLYPATLSRELIEGLLKGKLGFKGVVVTDALNMGGVYGWYGSKERTEIEAFRAGCDMVLWPTENYVSNMKKAIESGYISIERLDDAVSRIIALKEKLGLFDKNRETFRKLNDTERLFIKNTQTAVAENSVTIVRNMKDHMPIDKNKVKKILVVPVTNHEPAFELAKHLCEQLTNRGFEVTYLSKIDEKEYLSLSSKMDIILFALFSRPFRPIGFLDFYGDAAKALQRTFCVDRDKLIGVSFGSPYFADQYFEKAYTYVNAFSMTECQVDAFVRAMCGETEFNKFSPVKIEV